MKSEGFVKPNAGAVGEALEFVDPVGGDGLNQGLLFERPLKGFGGGEAAVSGALHGFGELEADEVAEALAVLEAEVVGGAGELGEGEVDGNDFQGFLCWKDTWLLSLRLREHPGHPQTVSGRHGCLLRGCTARTRAPHAFGTPAPIEEERAACGQGARRA